MLKIFTHPDPAWMAFLCEQLCNEGVPAILKNNTLSGGVGELPAHEVWPEIWILDQSNQPTAQQIIENHQNLVQSSPPWTCDTCGETIEGQFQACWNCTASTEIK